ncbi:pyridoxal phosphate-dependent decarboxylase family protein [Amycolatopsis anabasis]|uniref:pyridoxal phosphate-dependent decarboxylase family protein n=1 Tax=Amycolatopsis anabasis TaxID=1840409 RepID=UPI00131ADB3F|nr:pyridoxal-dependent decarboxylase [Amycolatopsis anabasis]
MDVALAGGPLGATALEEFLGVTLDALAAGAKERGGPIPAGDPRELGARWRAELGDLLPETGSEPETVLAQLVGQLAAGAADPADPACAAHLHCPPLAVAVAADTAVAAVNPSLDSWDQAPLASVLETELVLALARLVGFGPGAGGVITAGGTESNLMGLLLARDHVLAERYGVQAARAGVPAAAAGRLRILCSAVAHFSIARSAGFLGLGEDAVVPVAVDHAHRMIPAALAEELAGIRARHEVPVAIVATAGTTDLGGIDPIREVAAIARKHRAWFHVDAAYGGGALFSARLAHLLDGLDLADSVGLDLHKFGWQPVAAGAFLTRQRTAFAPLDRTVAYLNSTDDENAGYTSRLGSSLRTTRRADAVKIAVTLRSLGKAGLGELVDRCHDLAVHAAEIIRAQPRLELRADPVLSTVVFRYLPAEDGDVCAVNARLRRALLASGLGVIGRTTMTDPSGREAVYLKLTMLNPTTTPRDVDALLNRILAHGEAAEVSP